MSASQAIRHVGPKLKGIQFYYDLNCPNSWRALKYLETRTDLQHLIDYIPILSFRAYLHNNGLSNEQRPKVGGIGSIKFLKWSEKQAKWRNQPKANNSENRIVPPVWLWMSKWKLVKKRAQEKEEILADRKRFAAIKPESAPNVTETTEPERVKKVDWKKESSKTTDRLSCPLIDKEETMLPPECGGTPRPKRFYFPTVEYTSPELTYRLNKNWTTYFLTAILESALTSNPTIFCALVGKEHPELYVKSIYHLGTELWEKNESIYWTPKLCRYARELGIPYREAEDMISRISQPESRKIVQNSTDRIIKMGASSAPFFVLSYEDAEDTHAFGDVNELPKRLS